MKVPTSKAPGSVRARVRLGLIGNNIGRSRSPDLHRFAAQLSGLDVSYDLFDPAELETDFDALFDSLRDGGLSGLNVTYPYKELVVPKVRVADPLVARIGSVNTVRFAHGGAVAHNTDYTGFIAAFRQVFGNMAPGRVVLVGAGGVGKAVAFALQALGAGALTIIDHDQEKAAALSVAVGDAAQGRLETTWSADLATALRRADGIVNCTPVGMVGHPGSPVPAHLLGPQRWAFDAVYTPVATLFTQQAAAAGLQLLSGFELFFHQGIQAFRIFTGREPRDLGALRARLV